MDNWIYSANHTVRYRYLGNGKFASETTFSRGQWGITQDNAGRLFHNNNSDPIRYDAVPSAYYARNPALSDPAGVNAQLVPADLRIWPLRVTPGVNRGYKSLDSTGRITAVTAACGPVIYRGDLLPDLRDNVFVCEPSGNLIKRIALESKGDRLAGRNVYEGEEFIASTDERFRPVNLANGPDGGLYIVDMYHGIIQHRIYLTTYLRQQIESRGLADGAGMGRIYRVVPEASAGAKPAAFNLTKEASAQLIEHLKSPNGWWRDTAQRLLAERRDAASFPSLRALALDPAEPALARLQALWTLEGADGLDRSTLVAALGDPDATVCAAAIRLSEPFLARGDDDLLQRVSQVHPEADAPYAVILQQSLSLGAAKSPPAVKALFELAGRASYSARAYVAEAIVSSLAGRETDFVALALAQPDRQAANPVTFLAATCVWRSGQAEQIAQLDSLLGAPSAPGLAAATLLASLKQAIPRQSDGKLLSAHLAAPPTALVRLASTDSPDGARAKELLPHLSWPGHENEAKATPLNAAQLALFEKGRVIFTTICAGCHQPNGQGLKGLAPSLVTSKWVAGNERALARIVLQGKLSENLIMPQLQALDDESLAGVLTFVRRSWGHGFNPVAPDVIGQARKETAGRAEPWTEKDLAKFLEGIRVGEGSH
jgi:mono/diheme cytochrome c family protein